MKYILVILLGFFIIGCEQKESNKKDIYTKSMDNSSTIPSKNNIEEAIKSLNQKNHK